MADITTPKARAVNATFAFLSPGDKLADALVAADRHGGLNPWTQNNDPKNLAQFTRAIEDFKVTVTIKLDGRAEIVLEGPAFGRPIDQAEFKLDTVKSALAGLPAWTSDNIALALAVKSNKAATPVVKQQADVVVTTKPSWFDRLTGAKAAPSAVDAGKQLSEERLKFVNDIINAALGQLKQIEEHMPTTNPSYVAYLDTSSQLRNTLVCAQRSAGTDSVTLQVLRNQYAKQVELVCKRAVDLYNSGDLVGRPEVAENLEGALRTLNDNLVEQLDKNVSSNLASDLAAVSNAAGTGLSTAMNTVQSVSNTGRDAALGLTKLMTLEAPKATRPATILDLINAFNTNNELRFFGTFSERIWQFLSLESEQPFFPFSDASIGPKELMVYSGGFYWRDLSGDREVIDSDLASTSTAAVVETIEAMSAKVQAGLREYLRPTAKNVDAFSAADLMFAFQRQVGSPAANPEALRKALADASFELAI